MFKRRGLRNRAWAVEWDASAIDFLLEKGFTVELGARPLKRAVERHFLAPLAATIVKHQFPEGDQFLFVRRGESALKVEFIDPDAPEPELVRAGVVYDELPAGRRTLAEPPADLRVKDLTLGCRGTAAELDFLAAQHTQLGALIEAEDFKGAKQSALAATASPGFWSSPDRFKVLGRAEFLDRIESSLRSAGSLIERLASPSYRERERLPRDLLSRLAQTLYPIRRACADAVEGIPNEAFLLVEAGHGGEQAGEAGNDFARRLGQMYRGWAKKRHMRVDVLEESGVGRKPYRLLLAVSGYAAYSILAPENGLHFFEVPKDKGKNVKRLTARVRVSAQADEPIDGTTE
jgi:ATP-dependent Clp protease ATP-binding subunit ClpC